MSLRRIGSRDLAYCGLFGAASLLFPVLFHVLHIGNQFMPMYLPLCALAFLAKPLPSSVTAFLTPLISGAVTGMPPFYPPVAVCMAIELSAMVYIIAWIAGRWPKANERLILIPVLLLGRVIYVALVYGFSLAVHLPANFMAALSIVSGWPGIILIAVAVPPIARASRRIGKNANNQD